ncbi:MAG TPA: hypothetical protein VFP94_08020 [Terriglobales bacterium]|nr:hypothetical protein [Terriglobales bacterium]
MRHSGLITFVLAFGLAAAAQAPPAHAVDITSQPAAPSAEIAAPAAVLRVYIDALSGADASAVQALLTQALFTSQKVVITENQANASLILKGQVLRQAPPPPAATSKISRRHKATPAADAPAGITAPVTDLDPTTDSSLSPAPMLLDMNPVIDLSKYQYRLDLRLLDPQGDLVWMSGQGDRAPSFAAAQAAVQATVTPLLAALDALKPPGATAH